MGPELRTQGPIESDWEGQAKALPLCTIEIVEPKA